MAQAIEDFDVVIVGGGIVGLSAACLLAPMVKRIALVNQSPASAWSAESDYGLRVTAVNLASQKLLTEIGVWKDIQQMRCTPYHDMVVWQSLSEAEVHFSANTTGHTSLGAIVENNVLVQALTLRLKSLTNVSCYEPSSMQNFSELSDNSVLIELENAEGQRQRLTSRLLIGADGVHSKVRSCAGIATARQDYQQSGVVCTVLTEKSHENTAWQCFSEEGPLALLPLAAKQCSIVWSLDTAVAKQMLALSEDDFNARLSAASEYRLGGLQIASKRVSFPLSGSQANEYVGRRVVLLGDAAHAIHPLAGLGLNLGLEDLRCLQQLIQSSDRELGSERILQRYQRARKTENSAMQKSLEAIDKLFRQPQPWLRQLRSLGFSASNHCKPIKMAFMRRALGIPL